MKLKPLEQWICDSCGEVINSPSEGYVQWQRNDNLYIEDYKIVHHKKYSPNKKGCYIYDYDDSLEDFVGDKGIINSLSLLDAGPNFIPNYTPQTDIRKWTEFFRRLHIPYYEEARLYWGRAKAEGYFADSNEIRIYQPDFLKELIENYQN